MTTDTSHLKHLSVEDLFTQLASVACPEHQGRVRLEEARAHAKNNGNPPDAAEWSAIFTLSHEELDAAGNSKDMHGSPPIVRNIACELYRRATERMPVYGDDQAERERRFNPLLAEQTGPDQQYALLNAWTAVHDACALVLQQGYDVSHKHNKPAEERPFATDNPEPVQGEDGQKSEEPRDPAEEEKTSKYEPSHNEPE